MPQDFLNFEEHRRRRQPGGPFVDCVRCGQAFSALATNCPVCGYDAPPSDDDPSATQEQDDLLRVPRWVLLTIVVALGIFVYYMSARR